MKRSIFLIMAIIICTGCAAPSFQTAKMDPSRAQYVDGTVQSVSGGRVAMLLKVPEFTTTADTPAAEITRQIVQKGLFVEGMNVDMDGNVGELTNISGNSATVAFSKAPAYSAGQNVQLRIPKKRIAVVDFTVIKGSMKEAGTILMEQVSSSLIETKQFSVVERSKLNAIMEEIKLIQSGMTEEIPADMRPKLMFADLILTGSLAEIGDKYDINMRLLNVRTGHAIAAISLTAPLFKPSELRDSSAMDEDFEKISLDHSWTIGQRGRWGYAVVDGRTGAEGSKKSFRLDYALEQGKVSQKQCVGHRNNRKRDLSLYQGLEFYVKGTHPVTGYINLDISDRENPNLRTRWFVQFPVTEEWQLVRVPFNEFSFLKTEFLEQEGFKTGKQVFDATRIESLIVGTCNNLMKEEYRKGSLWIDKVRFYKQ